MISLGATIKYVRAEQSWHLLVTFVPELLHVTGFLIADLSSLFVSLFADRSPLSFLWNFV